VYNFPRPGNFEEIVKPFPRLVSLKTGYMRPFQCTPFDLVLPPLQHLSYECDTLDIEAYDFLANLNLSTLEINFNATDIIPRSSPLPRLESLNKLSLVSNVDDDTLDEPIWESSLINIIDCCPNITSLRLFDPTFPDYNDFLSSISHMALRITSLELDSQPLSSNWDIHCDHLLPRFSKLVYLSLGDGTVSSSLPSYLRQLPRLKSLRMGHEAHWNLSALDFFALLQGPTRHPSLRHLAFNCFGGQIGRRIEVNEILDRSVDAGMSDDGWQRPSYRNAFMREDGLALQSICEENRIVLSGDATSASEIEEEYNLEEANRSVLRCLQLKSLDKITCDDGSPYFDHVPIAELDPQNLKLVKTELPEKNWYALSLE